MSDVDGYFDVPFDGCVRRWSTEPLVAHPGTTVVIQVAVTCRGCSADAHLVTIRTRKVP